MFCAQDKEASDLVALVEQHKAEVQREKESGEVPFLCLCRKVQGEARRGEGSL